MTADLLFGLGFLAALAVPIASGLVVAAITATVYRFTHKDLPR